ncbi:MAG: hypothetical protein FJ290_09695 [Planctomycetes bacterium]|nr:hypothetical protein [Planctomycetota bacterium]
MAQQMSKDPIVEEIHAVRRRIARECGYDTARIMDLLRKSEAEHQEGLATPRKQEPPRQRMHRRRARKLPVAT